MMVGKIIFLFQGCILRFDVNLPECCWNGNPRCPFPLRVVGKGVFFWVVRSWCFGGDWDVAWCFSLLPCLPASVDGPPSTEVALFHRIFKKCLWVIDLSSVNSRCQYTHDLHHQPHWECLHICMTFSAPEISAPGIGTTFTVCLAVAPWTLDMGSRTWPQRHHFLGVILGTHILRGKKNLEPFWGPNCMVYVCLHLGSLGGKSRQIHPQIWINNICRTEPTGASCKSNAKHPSDAISEDDLAADCREHGWKHTPGIHARHTNKGDLQGHVSSRLRCGLWFRAMARAWRVAVRRDAQFRRFHIYRRTIKDDDSKGNCAATGALIIPYIPSCWGSLFVFSISSVALFSNQKRCCMFESNDIPKVPACSEIWTTIKLSQLCLFGGFLKWWVSPTNPGVFLLKMISTWGVKWGYHHWRKLMYSQKLIWHLPAGRNPKGNSSSNPCVSGAIDVGFRR